MSIANSIFLYPILRRIQIQSKRESYRVYYTILPSSQGALRRNCIPITGLMHFVLFKGSSDHSDYASYMVMLVYRRGQGEPCHDLNGLLHMVPDSQNYQPEYWPMHAVTYINSPLGY